MTNAAFQFLFGVELAAFGGIRILVAGWRQWNTGTAARQNALRDDDRPDREVSYHYGDFRDRKEAELCRKCTWETYCNVEGGESFGRL